MYGYSQNNPISFVDPLGLQAVTEYPLNQTSDPFDPGRELKMWVDFGEKLGGSTNPAQGAQYWRNAELGFYAGMAELGVGYAGAVPNLQGLRGIGNIFPRPSTPVRSQRGIMGAGVAHLDRSLRPLRRYVTNSLEKNLAAIGRIILAGHTTTIETELWKYTTIPIPNG